MTSASTATQRARPHGPAWMVLSLACACQFMAILDVAIVNVALPSVQRDLGFTPTGLAWVVNGYLLAFAGFMLLGGRAADLFGLRRMLVAGCSCSLPRAWSAAWRPHRRSWWAPASCRAWEPPCWSRRRWP